jgi:hypothetical protein
VRRIASGVGFVVLIVTLAIVLLLVARAWRGIVPAATAAGALAPAVRETESVAPRELPDLHETREQTGEHARRVEEALAAE